MHSTLAATFIRSTFFMCVCMFRLVWQFWRFFRIKLWTTTATTTKKISIRLCWTLKTFTTFNLQWIIYCVAATEISHEKFNRITINGNKTPQCILYWTMKYHMVWFYWTTNIEIDNAKIKTLQSKPPHTLRLNI